MMPFAPLARLCGYDAERLMPPRRFSSAAAAACEAIRLLPLSYSLRWRGPPRSGSHYVTARQPARPDDDCRGTSRRATPRVRELCRAARECLCHFLLYAPACHKSTSSYWFCFSFPLLFFTERGYHDEALRDAPRHAECSCVVSVRRSRS